MLKASNTSLSYDSAKSHADRAHKDVDLGIFEIARKVSLHLYSFTGVFRNAVLKKEVWERTEWKYIPFS